MIMLINANNFLYFQYLEMRFQSKLVKRMASIGMISYMVSKTLYTNIYIKTTFLSMGLLPAT